MDDRRDGFALMHELEGVVDGLDTHSVGDERGQLEITPYRVLEVNLNHRQRGFSVRCLPIRLQSFRSPSEPEAMAREQSVADVPPNLGCHPV